jgi:predicted metal-dependent phosphoesterase TrpH
VADESRAFRCELHVHSTYSDGSASPDALLRHAAKIGLSVVAITDHDNARGARIAVPVAAGLGIELIPAVEFTAQWGGVYAPDDEIDVDVLGYFVRVDAPAFVAHEQAALDDVERRIAACCERLTASGYPVTMAEGFAENLPFVGLRHLRDVLVRKGYFENSWDAGKIVYPAWFAGPPSRFTIAEQIAVIHAAGGVAVLAHPGYTRAGEPMQARDIAALVEIGLDGIEVYHRVIDGDLRVHMQALADQFGLVVTGGSDEHGWSPDLPLMGTEPVTRVMVEALRARAARYVQEI